VQKTGILPARLSNRQLSCTTVPPPPAPLIHNRHIHGWLVVDGIVLSDGTLTFQLTQLSRSSSATQTSFHSIQHNILH
jgi:hypothetical protein